MWCTWCWSCSAILVVDHRVRQQRISWWLKCEQWEGLKLVTLVFYLDEENKMPLTLPTVEQATNKGIRILAKPRTAFAKLWINNNHRFQQMNVFFKISTSLPQQLHLIQALHLVKAQQNTPHSTGNKSMLPVAMKCKWLVAGFCKHITPFIIPWCF